MLKPDDRSQFNELMRPPLGYTVDAAVGTTFSLDLLAALIVPLGFAVHDWTDDEGGARDPLATLEAIHRYSEKLTVFCEEGQIKVPREYRKLVTWLETMVHEVRAPDPEGSFHPKLWILRFTEPKGSVLYRVLCLSRNLTFDRSWDTAVIFDGQLADRELSISRNHPLADFVYELPRLARKRLPEERRIQIRKIADELRRVHFDVPDGFDDCRFWHGGLRGSDPSKCWGRIDRALIVSPFISDSVVRQVSGQAITFLVSRPDTLQALDANTLDACKTVYALDPAASLPGAQEDEQDPAAGEVLSGLHAKLLVLDRGRHASVFSGSFNATRHAFHHNVEFMVELIGKRSRVGVDEFLARSEKQMKFINLLTEFRRVPDQQVDDGQEQADKLFRHVKRGIIDAEPVVAVRRGDVAEYYDAVLQFRANLLLPTEVQVTCWPISIGQNSARPIIGAEFSNLSCERLTPLMAFEIMACVRGTVYRCQFVTKALLDGAPLDREQRIFASFLANQESLSRFLLLSLAAGDPTGENTTEAVSYLKECLGTASKSGSAPSLFETLLRTLAKQPSQLDRIEKVIRDLRGTTDGAALLTEEFLSVWEPVWSVRRAQSAAR